MKPVRIQLRRTARFNLQETSAAINGLPAMSVARPHRYGNPYVIKERKWEKTDRRFSVVHGQVVMKDNLTQIEAGVLAVQLFKAEALPRLDLAPLRGQNLACFCAIGMPCHGDVLVEAAND